MTINKAFHLSKVVVRILIMLLLPIVASVVLIPLTLIFNWGCFSSELSILLKVALAYSGLALLFFMYIISPNRNRCCGSTRVKIGRCLLLILAIASLYFSADIDIFCCKKVDNNNCEISEINDPKSEGMKIEYENAKKLLLVIFSNSNEKSFTTYAFFETSVIEKTNIIPICSSSNFP